jgi:hypothetical protein
MTDLVCVNCGHRFAIEGATRRKGREHVAMATFVVIGGLMFCAGAAMLIRAIAAADPEGRWSSIGLAASGIIGGAGVAALGRALPEMAPFICPKCQKPKAFPSDSPQAIAWLDRHYPR